MGLVGAQAMEGRDELGTHQESGGLALHGSLAERRLLREDDIYKLGRHQAVPLAPVADVPDVPQELPPGPVLDEPQPTPEPYAEIVQLPIEEPLGGIEAAICALPWDCWTALRVAQCESNLRPQAVGAGSYGLMQIQASVHAHKWSDFWEAWMIPERNLEYAWEIYQGRGWYAWSCF